MQSGYYYCRGKQKFGPVSFSQLQQLATAGDLQPSDMVLQEGAAKWAEAHATPGLVFPVILDAAPAAPLPASFTPAAAGGAEKTWHYSIQGNQFGPVSEDEVRALLARGELMPADLVWAPSLAGWVPLRSVPQFMPRLSPWKGFWKSLNTPVGKTEEDPFVTEFLQSLKQSTPTPWVTYVLAGICLAVFILMVVTGVDPINPTVQQLIAWGADYGPLVSEGQYWRPLTCMFLHIGVIHLALNLWVLCDIGPLVERLIGSWRFLSLYLLSGVLASVASLWWHANVVSAGAFGAIFGIFGGLGALLLRNPGAIPLPVLSHFSRSTLGFLGYNLVLGLWLATKEMINVDNAAHIGGLVAGFLCGLVLASVRPLATALPQRSAEPGPPPLPTVGPGHAPSRWRSVGGAVMVVLVMGAIFMSVGRDGDQYGKRLTFGKGELYYKAPVTEAEAQKTGDAMRTLGFFSNDRQTSAQVVKEGNTYQIRLVVIAGAENDPQVEASLRLSAESFKALFNQQPVEIHLCDELLRTKKVIRL